MIDSKSPSPSDRGEAVRAWVDAALFYLAPLSDEAPFPDWAADIDEPPLVAPTVAGSGVAVATGIHLGPVLVELGDRPQDTDCWEERGSTWINVREPLILANDGGESITMFSPEEVGSYLVEVYAVNRKLNRDLALKPTARKNLERYLFVLTRTDAGGRGQ